MKKYLFFFIVLFMPLFVFAKDYSNYAIKNDQYFVSGDILYKNLYNGKLIPGTYFTSNKGNIVSNNVKVNFYKLSSGSTIDNPIYEFYSSYFYGMCNDEVISNFKCNNLVYKKVVMPQVDNENVHWVIKNIKYTTSKYNGISYISGVAINFYEVWYQEPAVKVVCEKSDLVVGDDSKCSLSFNNQYDMSKVSFSLLSDYLDISNLSLAPGWAYEEKDGVITLVYVSNNLLRGENDDVDVLSFQVSAKDNVEKDFTAKIVVKDFSYRDVLGLSKSEDVNVDINVKTDIMKNPNTSTASFIWLTISILIFSSSVLYILINRDILKEL